MQHVFVFLGIKEFTNWPTIPQIFIGGEFIGGCDILLQMHKNGELIEELQKVGIQSTLLEQEKKEEELEIFCFLSSTVFLSQTLNTSLLFPIFQVIGYNFTQLASSNFFSQIV